MTAFELTLYWYQSLFNLSAGLHMIKKNGGGGVSALEHRAAKQWGLSRLEK